MPVWVQLTSEVYVEERGRPVRRLPGDWVKVGRALALEWIQNGQAIAPIPEETKVEAPEGSVGVMVFGGKEIPDVGLEGSTDGVWDLRWHLTAFYTHGTPVNLAMFGVGFKLITKYEIAVPLIDYAKLADSEHASDEEKAATAAVIRDLRVPLYDIRLMFVRRCDNTERLFEAWEAEGGYTRLSFLRALYYTKPLILALPVTWTGQKAPTHG